MEIPDGDDEVLGGGHEHNKRRQWSRKLAR